jgi:large subunit ribosomal protein L4
MAEIPVKNLAGEQVETITVSDAIFGAPINGPLMHQAVQRILADRRLGTHKAKTRSEVHGSGQKPWRQKGTGRARQGMRTSPLFKGGGVVFPPSPRSYAVRMPKKMRRAATRSALTSRLSDGGIQVVSSLQPAEPRTRLMAEALQTLNASGKVLLVDASVSPETNRASRNLPGVNLKPASTLNIVDILDNDVIVFSVDGIRTLERLLSDANV